MSAISALTPVSPTHFYSVHPASRVSATARVYTQASMRPSVSPCTVPFTRKIKRCRPPPHKIKRRPTQPHKSAVKRCSAQPHKIKRCPPQPHKIKPSATQAQASLKPCTCAARTCPSLEHTSPCTQDRRNRSHGTTTTTCECVCACVRVCVCVCVSACV